MGRDGASTISSESSEFTSSAGAGAVGCSPETGGSAETETGGRHGLARGPGQTTG